MTSLKFLVLFLLLQPAISLYYQHYLSGKKPMIKVWEEADFDKDMCAPVSDFYCGDMVAVIVDKGDFNFKCVIPCRFFANMSLQEVFKCPDANCTVKKRKEKVSEDQFWVDDKGDKNICQVTEGKLCCKRFQEKDGCLTEIYHTPWN